MSAPAIETQALVRDFGENRAVDGVDLRVERGEVYGFLGPNGAGKSTCVRMLCTLLAPTSGTARVAGADVVRDPVAVRLRIGVALQDASLDPKQTGREILTLQGRLFGMRGPDLRTRVDALIELVGIGEAIDRMVGTYSGGMRRRLDLATALVHGPEVLFLDEPTTGLDPISRNRVWDEVRRLNREGTTIFLTTQYLEEADALAGRVGIIDGGRIVAEGAPAELKQSVGRDVIEAEVEGDAAPAAAALAGIDGVESVTPADGRLVVRARDGAAALSPVALALAGAGVRVRNLALRTATLDDVFLQITGHAMPHDAAEEQS